MKIRLLIAALLLLPALASAAPWWQTAPGGAATTVNDANRLMIEQSGVGRTITRGLLLQGLLSQSAGDLRYSLLAHSHDYSPSAHHHNGVYSLLGHTHNYLSDAPSDGNRYARQNGAWSVVTSGGTGAVDSVNAKTGIVVLDAGDIAETASRVYLTPAQETKLDNIPTLGTAATAASTSFATAAQGVLADTALQSGHTSDSDPHTGYMLESNIGTTANKYVQLDANARLPAVDGSQLTNLPGSAVTSFTTTTFTGLLHGNGSVINALTPTPGTSALPLYNGTAWSMTSSLPISEVDVPTAADYKVNGVALSAANIGALPDTTTTVAALLQYGYVFSFRSDSPACDTGHADYTATNAWLAARGINDTNITCDSGFAPLVPSNTVTITSISATGAVGTLSMSGQRNVTTTLSGVYATGELGTLSVSAPVAGDASAGLSGVAATGQIASIGVSISQNGTVTLSGVEVTAGIGTVGVTAAAPSGNDFAEAFGGQLLTGDGGVWTVTTGTPTISSGRLLLDGGGVNEGVYVPTTMSRGFYVQFDLQQGEFSIFQVEVGVSSAIREPGSYRMVVVYDVDEGEQDISTRYLVKDADTVLQTITTTQNTVNQTWRFEFPATGGMALKRNGIAAGSSTDNTYGTFSHLKFYGSGGASYVDNVTVGSL